MHNTIQDTLLTLLPAKKKTSPSGWMSFSGPCCVHNGESPDKRGRGGVITNGDGSISYHCFNCGFKANYKPGRPFNYKMRKLFQWLGAEDHVVKGLTIEALRLKDIVDEDSDVEDYKEEIVFKKRDLPEDTKPLLDWIHNTHGYDDYIVKAAEYAMTRGLDDKLDQLLWSPARAANMNRRIIVPFNWKRETIGFTARALDEDIKPKYYNAMEPGYVFNTDAQAKDNKFVLVVEGPFDALKIDGVSVLGNTINETQADIIDNLYKDVIVVPDRDRAGQSLIDAALEYGWNVSFPDWEDDVKDVSDAVDRYGKLYTLWSILQAKQTSRIKIELMRKKLGN
jgi:hypothetical protein